MVSLAVIRTVFRPRDHAHDGGDVDNPSPITRGMRLLLQHPRESILAAEEYGLGVDPHRRVPGCLVGQVQHSRSPGLNAYPRIVDQAVDASIWMPDMKVV